MKKRERKKNVFTSEMKVKFLNYESSKCGYFPKKNHERSSLPQYQWWSKSYLTRADYIMIECTGKNVIIKVTIILYRLLFSGRKFQPGFLTLLTCVLYLMKAEIQVETSLLCGSPYTCGLRVYFPSVPRQKGEPTRENF